MSAATQLQTAPFSLLMSVYKGDTAQQLLQAYLSSVQLQTLAPAEAVIVQDGPVSAEVAEALKEIEATSPIRVKIVRHARNRGLGVALNSGIAACSYDVIARMDADDYSLPERFARQWEKFQAEQLDLLGAGMYEFDTDPQTRGLERKPPATLAEIKAHARTHNPVNHPTMMYRKAVVERVDGYLDMGSMEDYWLVIRLLASGAKLANIPEPLVAYRAGGVYSRRGGFETFKTELRIQRQMLRLGLISPLKFLINCATKGTYRLLPGSVKRILFGRFVAGGLPSEKSGANA